MLWDTVDLCVDPIMNQTWTVSNASTPCFNWKFMLQNMGWKAFVRDGEDMISGKKFDT